MIVLPCPKCKKMRLGPGPSSLRTGDPGTGTVELDPVDDDKATNMVQCINGHRFKIFLEDVGIFGQKKKRW